MAWVKRACRRFSRFSYCFPSTTWVNWIASARWISTSTFILWSRFTSFSTTAWSLIWFVLVKVSWCLFFARSQSSNFCLSRRIVFFAFRGWDWSDFALELASSSCWLKFLSSWNKSERELWREYWGYDCKWRNFPLQGSVHKYPLFYVSR